MSDLRRLLGDLLPPEAVQGPDGDGWRVGGRDPEAVVAPASAEDVAVVLEAATRDGFGVVPMGGRTSLGPEAPSRAFVALSTERMAGVDDYEPADLTVTVSAGATLEALDRTLAAHGQWLPVDPPLAPRRTVGGLTATGTPGLLATAYGSPRDHVLGLTAVTGDGRILRLGGRVMKNVAGFDLVRLMVGSRGTLGVITSVSLRLFPRPSADTVLVLGGASPGALLESARRLQTAAVVPASAVLAAGVPGLGEDAALVVRVQGASASVEADSRTLLGEALPRVRVLKEGAAADLLAVVRDGASEHPVVLRAFALPAHLAETAQALAEAAPGAALVADVLSGRVRAGVADVAGLDIEAVLRLRARMESLGGTLVVERCLSGLVATVPAYGAAGRASALGGGLRRSFDPAGVLSPGRFAW